MKITSDGWFNLIFCLLIIVVFLSCQFYGYKIRKNSTIGKIIYIDKLNTMYVIGIMLSLICFMFFIIGISIGKFNEDSIAVPLFLGSGFSCLSQINKVIITEKGVGRKNFWGNVYLFVDWNSIDKYKWSYNRLDIISKKLNFPKVLSISKVHDKDEIINLIRKYDSNYAE